MLERGGRALALAPIDAPDETALVDLDEPRVLRAERLRPSVVATRRRSSTQEYAARPKGGRVPREAQLKSRTAP